MPIIKSAKKKLRQDKKRNEINVKARDALKKALKTARKEPNDQHISAAYKELDTAAKKHVIHKNKAARLKSRLIHFITKSKQIDAKPA